MELATLKRINKEARERERRERKKTYQRLLKEKERNEVKIDLVFLR